jgi:Tol biopolymer transport system component/DNA-binding winged helix-turn-helix (wHTH) protein
LVDEILSTDEELMMGNKSFTFRFSDVEVREREFSLIKEGKVLPVEPKAFRVLLILLRNPQKLITKEELLNAVWGDAAVTENSLTRSIALLRRLLGDDIRNPQYIETVATVGYRFVCKVEVSEDAWRDLESTPKADDRSKENSAGTLADVKIAEAVNYPAQINTEVGYKGENGKQTDERRIRLLKWALPGAVLLVAVLAVAMWYMRRPLPPLRVTEYTQITHEGHRIFSIAGTDGSRLYFTWAYGPEPQSNAQVGISGGEIAPVPVALPLSHIKDVSPDGSALLVKSEEGGYSTLWNVELPGGSLRRLLTDKVIISAAWSPDGKSVVYSPANGDLDIFRSDESGTRKLATPGGYPDGLSWSPDGAMIRFSNNNRLWEMSSDGSGLHQLLRGWHPMSSQCCGRWIPDGKFFVFMLRDGLSNYYGNIPGSQLWVLDERRRLFQRAPAEPVQLTSGPIRWNNPIPSKDGTKIFAHGVIQRGELVRYDAQSRQFKPYLGGISAEFVSFSSDGQFVAYVTFPEGILWRANRDGSHPVQLTEAPLYPIIPRWSPDGSQILFCSYGSKGLKAYVMSSQGGTPRLLLPDEPGGQSDPGWSPDGGKIVFSTLESVGNFNSVLRVLDLGTHRVTTLSGSEGMWSPRWSPNGRFISGLHDGSSGGVKIIDLETQRWTQLQQKGECSWHTWSSDSQFIYCSLIFAGDDPAMFRARVSGGDAERVVDLKGLRFTGALDSWEGLDPTDTPMLLRDVGTDDIYALTLDEK